MPQALTQPVRSNLSSEKIRLAIRATGPCSSHGALNGNSTLKRGNKEIKKSSPPQTSRIEHTTVISPLTGIHNMDGRNAEGLLIIRPHKRQGRYGWATGFDVAGTPVASSQSCDPPSQPPLVAVVAACQRLGESAHFLASFPWPGHSAQWLGHSLVPVGDPGQPVFRRTERRIHLWSCHPMAVGEQGLGTIDPAWLRFCIFLIMSPACFSHCGFFAFTSLPP